MNFLRNHIPGMVISVTILFLCLMPLKHSSVELFTYGDKFIHIGMHGMLAFVFMRDLNSASFYSWSRKGTMRFVFLYSLILGCVVEVLQAIMDQGRFFDPFDVMANCIGASVGIWLGVRIFWARSVK